MKRMKRMLALVLAVGMLATVTGCGAARGKEQEEPITVYLSNVSYLNTYAPYLQAQFPEWDLQFVVGRAGLSFYEFMQENGDLPDILMVGTLSPRDSLALNPHLMDLSMTETAAAFHSIYLDLYENEDGSVRWLPAGGVLSGIVANKDLFDRYGIPLPTDYESFAAACKAFAGEGILGYTSDFKYEYTCLYTMLGSSMADLAGLEGTVWRQDYTNRLTDELDKTVWTKVFRNMERFVKDTGLVPEDVSRGYTMTLNDLAAGKLAMLRGTSSDIVSYSNYGNMVMLPYFGETEEDNWLLTVPAFHVALSGELAENEERQAKALAVMEAMLSAEALELLTENYLYLHSFNQNGMVQLPQELENLQSEVQANRLYIAQTDLSLYAAATAAVQGLIKGEVDAEGAYAAANEAFRATEEKEEEEVFASENAYPYAFTAEMGNQAGSSMVNTLRTIAGTDVLMAPAYLCTSSLYATSYTMEQLDNSFMASGNRLYTGEMTGAEMREVARLLVEGYGGLMVPFGCETLPLASGVMLTVEEAEGSYQLVDISINGETVADEAVYSVGLIDLPERVQMLVEEAVGEGAFETLSSSGDTYARNLWVDYLVAGNQPEAPTAYLTLQ